MGGEGETPHKGFRPLIVAVAALDQYKDTRDHRLQVQYVYFKFYDKSYHLSPAVITNSHTFPFVL